MEAELTFELVDPELRNIYYFTKDNVERQTHLCTLTNLRKVTVSVSDPEPYWICVQWPKGDFLLIVNVLF